MGDFYSIIAMQEFGVFMKGFYPKNSDFKFIVKYIPRNSIIIPLLLHKITYKPVSANYV